ncbi:hypothetical protein [Legionella gresilensis]|uniref:hypothetical protein n=1 Tax=Legionella gresilensis TaxID=91823 RepID=UPI00104169AA|nr:hypothetical protein [Legionella gresilensis]
MGISKRKKFIQAAQLFSHLATHHHQTFGMKVSVFGHELYLAGSKNSRELLIVITNQPLKIRFSAICALGKLKSFFVL